MVTPETLTDEMLESDVIDALLPPGAPIKLAEIVNHVAIQFDVSPHAVYGALGPITQRLKRQGRVEYVKGPGSGWRTVRKAVR